MTIKKKKNAAAGFPAATSYFRMIVFFARVPARAKMMTERANAQLIDFRKEV